MVTEIPGTMRRVPCSMACAQYAEFIIYGRKKELKVCRGHLVKLTEALCNYGMCRRAAQKIIEEKGV